jgi:hypothetical protein
MARAPAPSLSRYRTARARTHRRLSTTDWRTTHSAADRSKNLCAMRGAPTCHGARPNFLGPARGNRVRERMACGELLLLLPLTELIRPWNQGLGADGLLEGTGRERPYETRDKTHSSGLDWDSVCPCARRACRRQQPTWAAIGRSTGSGTDLSVRRTRSGPGGWRRLRGRSVWSCALELHDDGSQFAVRPIDDAIFDFGDSDFTVQLW